MIEENEHIDILIGKILTGEASEKELQEFDHWINLAPQNADYFRQMGSLYHGISGQSNAEEYDVDKAWNKISDHIQSGGKVIQMKSSPWRIWEMAAVVMVLLGLGVMVYLFRGKENVEFAVRSSDSVITDTLPDGSSIKLNAHSDLQFTYHREKHERRATLKGEAYFQVVHQETEAFIVDVGDDVWVKDIGTAFNVTALPGDDSVKVFVREGVVQFGSEHHPGIELHAGEAGLYLRSTGQFSLLTEQDEQLEPSWADHEFNFRNAPLRRVIRKINKVYGDKIELDHEALGDCRISVHLMNDDAETIADVIAETMGWKVSRKGDKLILQGEACQ
ncbi:MAG: FecR domain-containing protein [Flavobacteriales bacterium]|nr:FecR domain-containing protein [Flavobacteriales bacterium]